MTTHCKVRFFLFVLCFARVSFACWCLSNPIDFSLILHNHKACIYLLCRNCAKRLNTKGAKGVNKLRSEETNIERFASEFQLNKKKRANSNDKVSFVRCKQKLFKRFVYKEKIVLALIFSFFGTIHSFEVSWI